jgi:hypothetical protein
MPDEHAEMQAGDAIMEVRADPTEAVLGTVGIAKLCCGKCTLALEALDTVHAIHFHVLEPHLKTYATKTGWPVPRFLTSSPAAMKAFLGDAAYAIYQVYPSQCLQMIRTEKFDAPSFARTDITPGLGGTSHPPTASTTAAAAAKDKGKEKEKEKGK